VGWPGNDWSTNVSSREVLAEATRWLVELETSERFDDVWDEFDDWFQASAAHRAAYERVRRHWFRSSATPTPPAYKPRPKRHWDDSYHRAYVVAWISDWWLPFAVLIALLLLIVELYPVGLPTN
jgi:ferric-dicitrate binding protein FerR (iron transport regulator)